MKDAAKKWQRIWKAPLTKSAGGYTAMLRMPRRLIRGQKKDPEKFSGSFCDNKEGSSLKSRLLQ